MYLKNLEILYKKLRSCEIKNDSEFDNYVRILELESDVCTTCKRFVTQQKISSFKIKIKCSFCDKTKILIKETTIKPIDYSYTKLIYAIFYYANDFDSKQLQNWLEISEATASKFILNIQNLLLTYEIATTNKLGSHNDIIEIDESCFGRRKYNVGRTTRQVWVWGAISRSTGKFIIRTIPSKKKKF
jgi:hypothetical protein